MIDSLDSAARVAWLFTRGEASVRIDLEASPGAVSVTFRGPGTRVEESSVADSAAALDLVRRKEQELVEEGFVLQAVADRRSAGRSGGTAATSATKGRERKA